MCVPPYLVIFFILRSILSDMKIATSTFFCLPFAWNIFFHHLIFGLCVSLVLKWVSCRQHIHGSCFWFHSASLCLLVGAFNPFTFKVIIDMYVPIAIFCLFEVDFVDLFSSVVFLDYISPFNICCKAGFMVPNSFHFCLSEKFFISPSILSGILARYNNLGCRFFLFSILNMSCQSLLSCSFCWKDQLLSVWGFPCMLLVAFPLLLLTFFLCI